MKFFKTHLIEILTLAAIATTAIVAAETDKQAPSSETRDEKPLSAAELTATRCLICHGDTIPGQGRLAPPFAMVKSHYQSLDEAAFIQAVSSWVKEPGEPKSQMPGAIRRFGLMPALAYPDADLAAIAKYVYETDFSMPGRGGRGMGQGGGGGCGPGNATGVKDQEGCGEGCGTGKGAAPEAAGSCCNACEPDESDARTSAAGLTEKVTPVSPSARKWPIPAAMMVHLLALERDVTAFEGKAPAEHADLAKRIEKHLKKLISSCTMEGEGHNALHDWLVPFRELAKQQAESNNPAVKMECVREMHRAFTAFHEQFVSAPRS